MTLQPFSGDSGEGEPVSCAYLKILVELGRQFMAVCLIWRCSGGMRYLYHWGRYVWVTCEVEKKKKEKRGL